MQRRRRRFDLSCQHNGRDDAGAAIGPVQAVTIVWNDPFTTSVPLTVANEMGALSGSGCTPPLGSGGVSGSDQAHAVSNGSGTGTSATSFTVTGGGGGGGSAPTITSFSPTFGFTGTRVTIKLSESGGARSVARTLRVI